MNIGDPWATVAWVMMGKERKKEAHGKTILHMYIINDSPVARGTWVVWAQHRSVNSEVVEWTAVAAAVAAVATAAAAAGAPLPVVPPRRHMA